MIVLRRSYSYFFFFFKISHMKLIDWRRGWQIKIWTHRFDVLCFCARFIKFLSLNPGQKQKHCPLRKTGNKPSVVWFRSDLEDILTGSAQRGLSSLLPLALYLTCGNTFRSVCTILYFKALPPTTWLNSTKGKLLGQVHLRAPLSVKVMQLKVCCGLSNMRERRLVCLKGIFRSWEKIKPQCRC